MKLTPRREQGMVGTTFILSALITMCFLNLLAQDQQTIDTERRAVEYVYHTVSDNTSAVVEVQEEKEETFEASSSGEDVRVVYTTGDKMDTNAQWSHCLSTQPNGRLGNKMFAYAALISIAKTNFMWPCFPKSDELWEVFNLGPASTKCDEVETSVPYVERAPYYYGEDTRRLNYSMHIELVGYFHSWKYFKDIRHKIKEQYTFKKHIRLPAQTFLSIVLDKMKHTSKGKRITPVGVHIRLGDMQDYYNLRKGYTVVSLDYIETAMTYFLSIYGPEHLVFIVCSDDITTARQMLTGMQLTSQVPTFYADDTAFLLELSEYRPVPNLSNAAVQLCLLTLCRHNIISTGSFSWWSGWLSNGTVVYSTRFPKPYSELHRQFHPQDYFPPGWIGFDI